MQQPTCSNLRIRSTADAHVVFHAVALKSLNMISRRLDSDERRAVSSGCIYVWEERDSEAEATGMGIERWTDGIRWGPSRVRDEFLFYHQREPEEDEGDDGNLGRNNGRQSKAGRLSNMRTTPPSPDTSERGINREYPSHYRPLPDQERLIKQTYSVIVRHPFDARPARKWHLIAYFTQGSIDNLRTIDDVPPLANLEVPSGVYRSARTQKRPAPSSNALGSRSRAVDPPPHIPQSIAPWPPRIAGPSLTSFTPRAPRPHSYSNPVGRVGSFSPCPPHLDGAPRSSVSDQGFIFSPTSPSSQGCFPELPFAPDTNNGEAQGSYHYLPPLGPQLDIFVANSRGRTRNPEDERQLEAISKRLF